MVYLVAGLGYALVALALGAAAHGGALLGARWIGRKRFRWFDGAPAATSLLRGAAVRGVSVLAAVFVAFVCVVVAFWLGGRSEATLNVDVAPGPAARAGIRGGDRILSVDGKPIKDWEELRAEIRLRAVERRIELERAGQRLTLLVTPEDGRIGVTPQMRQASASFADALARANTALWMSPRGVFKAAFSSTEHTELVGPVAVVKSVGQSTQGSRLLFFALLATTFWPMVLGVHVFDALTLALFRVTHGWTTSAEADTARRARIFQTSLLCMLCVAAFTVLSAIQEGPGVGNGAVPGIILLAPAAVSGILLAAIAARLRFGLAAGVGFLVAGAAIPCAVFFLLGLAVYWQFAELRRSGYVASWLVVSPAVTRSEQ